MTEDTTNPETTADAQEAEATEPTTGLTPEAAAREVEKLRKENAKWRTKLREREEADKSAAEAKRKAEQTAEERAQEAERKATAALEAAEARVLAAERKAALAGKVANPDRVLRLMDDTDQYFDGSTPNVDAILKDYPEYAVKGTTGVDIPRGRTDKIADRLRPEDFRGKSPAWIEENLPKLKRAT